ncbi:MAG: hypothetical protein GXY81_04360 [Candidatus Cloacimonetes bacterium]|nr:hypothetical protein [Candidatus Cloacimonadota bacterium]
MHIHLRGRVLLLTAAILVCVFALSAQTRQIEVSQSQNQVRLGNNSDFGFDVSYSVGDLKIREVQTKEGLFDELFIEGWGHTNAVGEPKLPMRREIIAVPLGATVRLNINSRSTMELDSASNQLLHRVMPAQEPVSKSADLESIPFVVNEESYGRSGYNNRDWVQVEELGLMRGVRVIALDFFPVRYDPVTGSLQVMRSLDLRVDFDNPDLIATADLLAKTASVEYDALYDNVFFNWDADSRANYMRHPTKYVILCPPAQATQMQEFVDWKTQQGYHVILTTVGTGGTVANTTTAIKAYMQGLWDNATESDPAPTYLLIVGDESGSIAIATNTGATDSHVTDLTYVRLNGTDYLPDMYWGRFSVSSTTELQNIIDKTVTFEKTAMPDLSYLGKTILIAGVDSNWAPSHGNGAINYATSQYFNTTHGINSDNYLYPASGQSAAEIRTKANEGRGYINYTAHGSYTSWADPEFNTTHVNAMTNTGKYGVMIGNCCITSWFNYSSPCFGEAVIRKANAGGVVYIGGINSTYWDEDYYWAVGYKTPINGTAPAYDANKLGAYDAVAHSHGEAYENWAMTVGDQIYMGNMAVQQSGSSRTNYYWEIYHIMGDPSLMPYMGVPTVNTATFPSTILIGTPSINITAEPYSRVALTKDGVIHATAMMPASGVLSLPITPFTTVGTAQLVFTAQNKITRIESIIVAPNAGPFVTVDAISYADNNNNTPEYNEAGRFNVTFKNVGNQSASNVTATLTCSTAGITITDNSETIASIGAGASIVRNNAFAFNIANNVADGTVAMFKITMVSGSETWEHNFTLTLNAPKLVFGDFTVTETSGNNNGNLDPGESGTLTMTLHNNGNAASPAGSVNLSCFLLGLTINPTDVSFSAIPASGSTTLNFGLTAASFLSVGTLANLTFTATAGSYNASTQEQIEIGAPDVIIIGSGTSTQGQPLNRYYNYSGHEAIYLASELQAAGTIKSLAYYKASGDDQSPIEAVKIYMKNTSDATLATGDYSTNGYTLVYDGSFTNDDSSGWMEVDLDTRFSYTGGNLAILIVKGHQAYTSSYPMWTYGTSSTARIRQSQNDYSQPTSLTSTNNLPNMRLKVFPAQGFLYPARDLTAAASHNSVKLDWHAPIGSGQTGFKIYRNGSLLTTVTAFTYTDTAVTNGTTYSYYVKAAYSSGDSEATDTVTATPNLIAPTNLAASPGNNIISLTWDGATGRGIEETPVLGAKMDEARAISGYKVYRNGSALTTVTQNSYVDNAVTNGTTYSYYVTTVYTNPAGESAASNTATATPNPIASVIIGTGTSSTGNYDASPISLWYQSLHGQSVYTKTELNAAGVIGPNYITHLGFNVTGLPAHAMPNYIIRMGHTTSSDVQSWISTGLDQNWHATSYQPTQTGWDMIQLATPFLWNGVDNIVLDTAFGKSGNYSSSGTVQYTTVTNGYRYARSDTADQTDVFTGGSLENNRPNIQLTIMGLQSDLYPPLNLIATPSHRSVHLEWAVPISGTPTGYKVFRNDSQVGTTTTALTYTDTGLTNGTTYTYYVTATYSDGESDPSISASATPNPMPPTNLTAIPGNNIVQLSWDAAAGRGEEAPVFGERTDEQRIISGYKVYRNGTALTTVAQTTYADNTANNGTAYTYYVTTVYTNPSGESSGSNSVTVTPSPVAIIGTGDESTGNNVACPINVYYQSLHGQSVYTRTELNALGVPAGSYITHIGFNVTGTPERAMPNYIIRMGHTSATNSQAFVSTGLTTVWTATSYQPTSTGWNMLTLDTPFLWNGVENIVVDTAFGLIGSYNSSGTVQATSMDYGYISLRSDSVDQTDAFTNGGTHSLRPNLQIMFTSSGDLPLIAVQPTSLAYDELAVGNTEVKQFTINNVGNQALTGTITTPTGYTVAAASRSDESFAKQDDEERNVLSFTIPAQQSKVYNLSFIPTAATTYNGNVVISSNANNSPTVNIAVTGSGFIPPTISLSSNSISCVLDPDDETTRILTISNTGSRTLEYSLVMEELVAAARGNQLTLSDKDRSIAGSTLVVDATNYLPGDTVDWTFTVTNASTDTEWLKYVHITFPTGVTVNSATNFVGGSGGDLNPNITSGNGITIDWFGQSGNWGVIQGGQTASATVNVTIGSSFGGNLNLPFTIDGDVYGAEPHTVSGTITLLQDSFPIDWVHATPMNGSIAGGSSAQVTLSFSSDGMAAGIYEALLTVFSNDPINPSLDVDVSMTVTGYINQPPAFDPPEYLSFPKNGSLQSNFGLWASDPDSDPLTLTCSGNSNINVDINGLMVTFSAAQNWVGQELLTFGVSDGRLTTYGDILVTVEPVAGPDWTPTVYPNNSVTVLGVVTLDWVPANLNDVVGAFAGGECRGVADVTVSDGQAYVTLLVYLATENEPINFVLYNYADGVSYPITGIINPGFGDVIGDPTPLALNAQTLTDLDAPVITSCEMTSTGLKLEWNPVPNAGQYQIWRSTDPYGDFVYLTTVSTTSFTDNYLGDRMFYHVIAITGGVAK